MSFNVQITLKEAAADRPEPFELLAVAGPPGDAPVVVAHGILANLSFGHVLQEVSRFLDLNVK